MNLILGIDPGTVKCGWCVLDDDELRASGTFQMRGDMDERLRDLWRLLNALEGDFDLVAVEMPPGHVKGHRRDVGLKVGMSIGIIKAFAFSREQPMLSIHHATVKKLAVGSGRASKGDVQRAMEVRFRLDEVAEDEADAIAVALAGQVLWLGEAEDGV